MVASTRLRIEGDVQAVIDRFDSEGWADGHPIVPPTVERVERFLDFARDRMGKKPADVIAVIDPNCGEATIEKIAINAVMAGCKPEYLPVVVAAVECLAEWREQLRIIQLGSHTRSPFLIINGPVRKELVIQSGTVGRAGGSWRANAAIGRAFRLVVMNIGGILGVTDKRTFGWLGSYSFCLAENEEDSPWEPYHVEHGYDKSESTVTLLAPEPPHHVEAGRWSYTGQELLQTFADSMCTVGSRSSYGEHYPIFVFGRDHANEVAAAGFSKADVKKFFYEHARIPLSRYPKNAPDGFPPEFQKFYTHSPHIGVPMVTDPSKFVIFVSGGPGPNSWYVPGFVFGGCTKKIQPLL